MNDLIKNITIHLSNGVEAFAALIIALAALQATWRALRLFFARPAMPDGAKTAVRLELGRWLSLAVAGAGIRTRSRHPAHRHCAELGRDRQARCHRRPANAAQLLS